MILKNKIVEHKYIMYENIEFNKCIKITLVNKIIIYV